MPSARSCQVLSNSSLILFIVSPTCLSIALRFLIWLVYVSSSISPFFHASLSIPICCSTFASSTSTACLMSFRFFLTLPILNKVIGCLLTSSIFWLVAERAYSTSSCMLVKKSAFACCVFFLASFSISLWSFRYFLVRTCNLLL